MKNVVSRFFRLLHRPFVKSGQSDSYHSVFSDFRRYTDAVESPSVLEIGSRVVTGISRREMFEHCSDYVGLDIVDGPGVDVVGDVHRLSRIFEKDRFDFVFSASVFEHLLFPWKAVLEINEVMKTGGYVYLSTHPAWPSHEMPWDFWRFPKNGFLSLFNEYTGFEIVVVEEGLPGRLYSLVDDLPTHDVCLYDINQGVSLIARKVSEYRKDLLRWDVDVASVTDTVYPR